MFESLKQQYRVARALNRKGLSSAAGLVIGAMITIIVVVQVVLPVVQDAVDNLTTVPANGSATVTGTPATILDILPTLVALIALVILANLIA